MLYKLYRYLIHNQIILALFIVVLGWLIFQIREILTSIFIAYIIMAALLPAAVYLRKKGLPHVLAVMLPFLSLIFFTVLIIAPLVPFFMSEITKLFSGLPEFIDESATSLGFQVNSQQVQSIVSREIENIGRNAFNFTRQVFGGVFSVLTILIISFYLLLYQDKFHRSVAKLFHPDDRVKVIRALNQVNEKLGAWLRGQFVLMIIIGLMSFTALTILNVPYALPLALMAGLLEIIPTLGPIISSVPAIIVALTISPAFGLTVGIVYLVIQLIENNFLVPKIMQRAVGLNPVFVIIAVMIGGNLMGVTGALLSIPFVSFLIVLYNSITAADPDTEDPKK